MESKIAVAILIAALVLFTPTPQIDLVSPDHGLNNGAVEVTINGSEFDNDAAVKLVKPGEADLNAINVKVISKKQIKCSFYLGGKRVGKWSVVVENTTRIGKKAKAATLVDGFTIEYPEPKLTAVDPETGLNTEVLTLNLTGSHFRAGARVDLIAPDQRILASDVKVVSGTEIEAGFDLANSLPGSYDLRVTNDDGKADVLVGGFTIVERQIVKPAISRIVPNEGYNDSIIAVEIHGENFLPGASVKLVGATGEEIAGEDVTVKNARELSCGFDLNQEPVGGYDVVVINPDGQEGILNDGFTINDPSHLEASGPLKPVFFDFDKAEIRPDQIGTMEANLNYLAENAGFDILLGGHADERGPREYNSGLSERRARAVQEYLVENGIDPSRITVYAYGEDYPLRKGHDENSWRYNRRVDLVIGDEPLSKEAGIIGNGAIEQGAE